MAHRGGFLSSARCQAGPLGCCECHCRNWRVWNLLPVVLVAIGGQERVVWRSEKQEAVKLGRAVHYRVSEFLQDTPAKGLEGRFRYSNTRSRLLLNATHMPLLYKYCVFAQYHT